MRVVDTIAHLLDRLLYYLLPYYQLSEVYDVLKLLNHILETHHLQVFIQLDILDDQGKSHGFARSQHQVLYQIKDLFGFLVIEKL